MQKIKRIITTKCEIPTTLETYIEEQKKPNTTYKEETQQRHIREHTE